MVFLPFFIKRLRGKHKRIQKESSYHAQLLKVICDGEEITDKVKELEMQEFRRKYDESEDLPF